MSLNKRSLLLYITIIETQEGNAMLTDILLTCIKNMLAIFSASKRQKIKNIELEFEKQYSSNKKSESPLLCFYFLSKILINLFFRALENSKTYNWWNKPSYMVPLCTCTTRFFYKNNFIRTPRLKFAQKLSTS